MAATNVQRFSGDVILSGNMNLQKVSNTATIKLDSNVVTEFPRSKKLIRYPRVALTAASGESSGYQGYYVTESSNAAYDLDRTSWKAFNMTFSNADSDDTWTNDEGTNYNGSSATYNPSADTPVKNLGTGAVDGEWIKLQLPHKIRLEYMKIWLKDNDPQRIPQDWILYGSDDNTNWTELFSKTGQGAVNENTYTVHTNSMYNYLAVVVTKISIQNDYFRIVELEYFGTPEYDPEAHGTDVTVKSYPNVPNTDWLKVYYDAKGLDDAVTVTTVNDLKPVGTAVNGVVNGNPQISDGAFTFDGSGDYISGTLTNTGDFDFTVSTWVFETNGTTNNTVWCIGDPSSANPSPAVALGIDPSGSLDFFVFGGIEIRMSNFRDTFGINKWHHIVCTRIGTTIKYFINGIDQGRPIANSIALSIATNSIFNIGARSGSQSGNNPMHGKIANFRIFNRVLTSDEIYQLYAYQKEYFGHGNLSMTLKAGRLGIGTSEPRAALDVRGDSTLRGIINVNGYNPPWPGRGQFALQVIEATTSTTTTNPGGGIRIIRNGDPSEYWNIGLGQPTSARLVFTASDPHGGRGGWIDRGVATRIMNNFTGQHRTFIKDVPFSRAGDLEGLIVSSDQNKYIKMSGGIEAGSNAITTNESLPIVSLSATANDKKCFGVISASEDPEERNDVYGAFGTNFEKEKGDTRVYINSLGEGAIWVSNINGSLESGDYITTSNVAGYGQKQESEFLANYTVAKITMDCDFEPATQPIQIIKKDETGENVLDEHDQIQWDNHTTETEKAYKIRYLDANGVGTDEANAVHIAAFVGCTYHCG